MPRITLDARHRSGPIPVGPLARLDRTRLLAKQLPPHPNWMEGTAAGRMIGRGRLLGRSSTQNTQNVSCPVLSCPVHMSCRFACRHTTARRRPAVDLEHTSAWK